MIEETVKLIFGENRKMLLYELSERVLKPPTWLYKADILPVWAQNATWFINSKRIFQVKPAESYLLGFDIGNDSALLAMCYPGPR